MFIPGFNITEYTIEQAGWQCEVGKKHGLKIIKMFCARINIL